MKKKIMGLIMTAIIILGLSVSVYSNCDCDEHPYVGGRSVPIPIEIYETE